MENEDKDDGKENTNAVNEAKKVPRAKEIPPLIVCQRQQQIPSQY